MAYREESGPVATQRQSTPQSRAIDAWIASDLARRYAPTLDEPLPADLLALLKD